MAYLKNSIRIAPFLTVSVGSLNHTVDTNIFGTGWFQIRRQECRFKNVVFLAVVLANGGHFLLHLNMAGKDQRFGEVFQYHRHIIIREAYPFFAIVLGALLKVG